MDSKVTTAIMNAREFFDIKDFPGNLFSLFEEKNYIEKHKLILFKEDIGKLSGFIGYGLNDITIICINYKRPIGHQNFTLAHELGHWFLHRGTAASDIDGFHNDKTIIECEANAFAAELLYPAVNLEADFQYVIKNKLLDANNRIELAEYIDELCHKYCLSFDMVLRKILFRGRRAKQYINIRKEFEKALGQGISCLDKAFYTAVDNTLPEYQRLLTPYCEMQKKINILLENKKIGKATAESIQLRNGLEFD